MAKYNLTQEHDKCIGCGSCVGICPDFWDLGDDGKAKPKKDSFEDDDLECNKQAADSCPVNIIHITKESGEKLI